ncbi:dienelactone hydrolase family protein [Cohnella sp. AR92]|uniref:dienelactone hydrolase family protein n=1 Tax=Cohnella sp. AR92 TaxID=648716 RepID=UPI000F8E0C21|nr:alpha/beta hydrolase family protein [Cohnella sp. AR92]RUS48534.1 dienelactone hydrolase [Cohnella sp. AR92]
MSTRGSVNAFVNDWAERAKRISDSLDWENEEAIQDRRARLSKILRIDVAKPDALVPKLLERIDRGDHIRERVEIGTLGGLRMPVYVLIPKRPQGPLPAVLALHGHGYGSRELVGLGPDGSEREEGEGIHKHFALSLARRGFVAIVPELIGFGDRRLEEDASLDETPEDLRKSSCYKLSSYLIHLGGTLAGIRTFEAIRAVDYALSRDEVKPGGVGAMGLSGGAFVGYLAAALDERLRASVLSGYPNTYGDSYYFSRQHCLCDYVPGIAELGDMPDLIGLIAPRAVFLEAGRDDPLFPLAGVRAAETRLRRIYREHGAGESFDTHVFEGKHEISGARSFDWLAERLGGRGQEP